MQVVLYLASDLLWASKIKGVADSLTIPCRPVRTLDMLNARLADSPVRALLLDLEAFDVAMEMLARVRGDQATPHEKRIRVLAFGPHVAIEALQAAREAGADEVMARGGFDHAMPEILLRLARE